MAFHTQTYRWTDGPGGLGTARSHQAWAQVLQKGMERELEGAYFNSHRTPDKTGEILQT